MAKRRQMTKSGSRRLFKATSSRAHILNKPRPMRGGTRL